MINTQKTFTQYPQALLVVVLVVVMGYVILHARASALVGDLNNDGVVNVFDLSILLSQWGSTGTADLNHDGTVNVFDLSILLSNWGQTAPTPTPTPTSAIGAYSGDGPPTVEESLGTALGGRATYAMSFLDGTSWTKMEDPSWFIQQFQGSGYSMIWGVPILPNTYKADPNISDTSGSAYGLHQGAGGDFNQYYTTLATNLVAQGQGSSIIRLAWEFNGNWMPWAVTPTSAADFTTYWRNIVSSMRSVPGANFKFEWNPTIGDQGVGNLADYYPSNNDVDYIGLDVYDIAWASYPGEPAEFHSLDTESYGLNWLSSFAGQQGKPIVLPEWGLGWGDPTNNGSPASCPGTECEGGDDPAFINDMSAWIKSNNVFESNLWDVNSSLISPSSNPNSYAAFLKDFGQ